MKELPAGPKKIGQTIYVRLWRAKRTEKQKTQARERDALRARLKRTQRTLEQKSAFRQADNYRNRIRYAKRTEEQKAKQRERDKWHKRKLRQDPEYRRKAYAIQRAWAKAHPQDEGTKLNWQRYRQRHRQRIKEKQRQHRQANLQKVRLSGREWCRNNRSKVNASYNKCYAINPQFRVARLMRCMLMRARKLTKWTLTMREAFGCDRDGLMAWLEVSFKPGMTWSNHGEWEIDHIRPIASFDLTNIKELRKVNHFTNLQALWKVENRTKSDQWEEPV